MLRSAGLRLGIVSSVVALAGLAAATAAFADGEPAPTAPPGNPAAQADGWLEWGLRGLFHAAALVFVAALVVPRLVGGRGGWPVPDGLAGPLAARLRERRRRIVADLGWVAVGTGVAATVADAATAAGPCSPCPLPAAAPDELAVAANAGSQLVAAWIRRSPDAVTGTVRVVDATGRPSGLPVRLPGLAGSSCGRGCLTFSAPPATRQLPVEVTEDGRRHTARLPTAWWASGNARARRLVGQAQTAMRAITSAREVEEVTSGPGSYARTDYRFRTPDRMALRTDRGVESMVEGERQWRRVGGGAWEQREYGAGLGFRTSHWFRWTPYARTARLLGVRSQGGRRVAELALYDEGTPVWLRLSVELATRHVLRERLTARAHYMTARYRALDRPLRIALPEAPDGR